MRKYTLGFIFNKDLSKVLLIHKNKPEWQEGKINGLGGKYEEDEDSFRCITREVKEEAALTTQINKWRRAGRLNGKSWMVDVMTYVYTSSESNAKSMESQRVEWFWLEKLPDNCLQNLYWLIPLCKDILKNGQVEHFEVRLNIHTS